MSSLRNDGPKPAHSVGSRTALMCLSATFCKPPVNSHLSRVGWSSRQQASTLPSPAQRHENGDYQRVFGGLRNPHRRPSRQSYSPLAGHGHRTNKTASAVRGDLSQSVTGKESSDLFSTRPPDQHDDRGAAYIATSSGPEPGLNFLV